MRDGGIAVRLGGAYLHKFDLLCGSGVNHGPIAFALNSVNGVYVDPCLVFSYQLTVGKMGAESY